MPNPVVERARWHLTRETGAITRPRADALRVALVYPNTYYVGMSSLAVHALYHLLNARPEVACERAFMPDPGHDAPDHRAPLMTIESQTPLERCDVIAFSLSFELDYINAADALRRARVPLLARERTADHPLVIAGGPCAAFNPEPMADLVDAFVVGEAEPVLDALATVLAQARDRAGALRQLQGLKGVYVPAAYEPRYADDGAFARLTPAPGAPRRIARLLAPDLDAWPTHTRIFTPDTEFGNMFLIEVSRGCAHACKFCVGAPCYRPYRHRSAEHVLEVAQQGLRHRRTIGLVGAAVSDYPRLGQLARALRDLKARISVSSIRADGASTAVVEALAESGAHSITFAPEAGTDRLRRRLRKAISEEQYVAAARLAAANGIRRLRLYFMLGLPGETDDDVGAIPRLVHHIKRHANISAVTVSVGAFVPKPQTAFEREAMAPPRYVAAHLKALRSALHTEPGVRMSVESPNWSFIQGALARGDRRLGAVIVRACEGGGALAAWRSAFAAENLDPDDFATRPREADEPLPWDHIGT